MTCIARGTSQGLCLALLACLVVCSSTCFVRNCPLGGRKRSMEDVADITSPRQCLRCGPDHAGHCIGPNICCGNTLGCYINTLEAAVCKRENDIPTPCEVDAEPCGLTQEGRCVADGFCCNDAQCIADKTCRLRGGRARAAAKHTSLSPEVLEYVRRLLKQRASGPSSASSSAAAASSYPHRR